MMQFKLHLRAFKPPKLWLGLILCFFSLGVWAQTGTIKGKVLDSTNDEPLPGANVLIKGTSKGTATDLSGEFQLNLVSQGMQTVIVSYLGYKEMETQVEVIAGQTATLNIKLESNAGQLGEIVIKGSLEGQEKALNQQRTSDNIKNIISADLIGRFPDLNVAEALQRVPGVNIERDRGEGGEVQMRGAPPSFTTINVNGEQIPGSQGQGQRNQELSTIPVDQLSSIEVTKAITPDQDGDNIGGTVDLKTPTAKGLKARGKMELGGGYNNIVEKTNFIGRASYNQRFFANDRSKDGLLGISVGGSYFSTNNGRDRTSYNYPANKTFASDGNQYVLPTFYRLRDLENLRTRSGLAVTFDLKFNDNHEIVFNYMYSQRFDRDEEKRTQFDLGRGSQSAPVWDIVEGETLPTANRATSIRRFTNPREFNVQTNTLSLTGNHNFSKFSMDWLVFVSDATNSDANGRLYDFRSPTFTADIDGMYTDFANVRARNPEIDVHDPFTITRFLDYDDRETWVTTRNKSFKLNFNIPFKIGENTGLFKVGGKYRTIDNERNLFLQEYNYNLRDINDADQRRLFATFISNQEDRQFFRNRVRFGPTVDFNKADAFIAANPNRFTFDPIDSGNESIPQFYDATEEVIATYVMAKIQIKKLMLLGGFRYERTNVDYIANFSALTPAGAFDPASVRLVSGGNNFNFFLPNFHAKYALDNLTNLRFAVTSSFARSNFGDLAPSERRALNNQEITRGNPNLLPARALNFDLMYEKYFKNVGIISGGVFYKRIRDFNYLRATTEPVQVGIDPNTQQPIIEDFTVEQPSNGDIANLVGAEVNLQLNMDFLPGIWKGLGLYANYTFTNSNGNTFERNNVRLPGQARHTGNVALSFDWKGFTTRAMLNFNGGVIRSLGPTDEFDTWRADRYQLDLSAAYAINKKMRVYAEFINLTNRPELEYFGVRSRPSNIEYFDWWNRFGISYSF
ncbi:MAG: TonB-dependent receptor [Microscillaceae bacterium]|jgi:TonB-dependent receptor|nr:TonB-dependent receptor [Microscillaceae bacterium]